MQPTARNSSPQEPPASGEIAVVESFLSALKAGDLDGALSLMSDDIVYQNVPFPADHGKSAVRRTLQAFGKLFTGFDVEIRNIAARNGVVLTERVDTLQGPLLYLDIWVCGTFEVRGGKIVLWRDYFDLAATGAKLLVSPFRWLMAKGRSGRAAA